MEKINFVTPCFYIRKISPPKCLQIQSFAHIDSYTTASVTLMKAYVEQLHQFKSCKAKKCLKVAGKNKVGILT